jgi:hypothetical protein
MESRVAKDLNYYQIFDLNEYQQVSSVRERLAWFSRVELEYFTYYTLSIF